MSFVLQTGEHEKRSELKEFLSQLASVSENLTLVERDENLRSPITFYLEVEGKKITASISQVFPVVTSLIHLF